MRRGFFALLWLLIFSSLWADGGVFARPRKVFLIKTGHFEILFPKESEDTAIFLADIVDGLYERAKTITGAEHDFSIPIIISPDSSVLTAEYTSVPYNRIVLFDSAPAVRTDVTQQGSLEQILYREIFRAVSYSVRSPFNHFIYKTVGGDGYQPVSLLYLPFSFAEGFSILASSGGAAPSEDDSDNPDDLKSAFWHFNDPYCQQLLIQAKIEGRFPTWFQASTVRDIPPGNDLSYAAATGFSAYLMQSRGIEKYMEFWQECGKVHLVLMNGIFYKVYGVTLRSVWQEFEDCIPVPENPQKMADLESLGRQIPGYDAQGLVEHIFCTEHGVVWYDAIRHEVDIFDPAGEKRIRPRQMLFLADDVTQMSLSPDRRYLSVSFVRSKTRSAFKELVTRIFDLDEQEFLESKFSLRDAGFVTDADGRLCIAGICADDKIPVLQVYLLSDDDDPVLIYSRPFQKDEVPHCVTTSENGSVAYLLERGGRQFFVTETFTGQAAQPQADFFALTDSSGNPLGMRNLRFERSGDAQFYTFDFVPETPGALSRSGIILLDGFKPAQVRLQNEDVSGGVNFPFFASGQIFYSAKKFSHDELRTLPADALSFSSGGIAKVQDPGQKNQRNSDAAAPADSGHNAYEFGNYNPFKYLFHFSIMPFIAIRDIFVDEGAFLWPALGLSVNSDSDMMRNTEFTLSAAADFFVLDFVHQINVTDSALKDMVDTVFNHPRKKFTFAGYITNTSTPVDIEGGALFNMSLSGEYDFKAIAKTAWRIPVGTIIRDMDFSISSIYTSSTDYYDSNKSDIYPTLAGWTPLRDAYEMLELQATVRYSNSHQYGISKYERRGMTLGARLYTMWDLTEMAVLNARRSDAMEQIESGASGLTQAQVDLLYAQEAMDVSQVNIGLFATFEIPRLTPFSVQKGWVLSAPASITAELLNKTGTALEITSEILLFGNEIQNGIPFLYLFFSRAGLKIGYDFCLNYDTTKVRLPDIRRENYWNDIFSQSYVSDSFYFLLDSDFLIPAGKLSKIQFNMNAKTQFFLRSGGFQFSLNFKAAF